MKQQINVKVDETVFECFANAAKGQAISQRQLFEDMLSLYVAQYPTSVAKGRKINEMEKRIREEE